MQFHAGGTIVAKDAAEVDQHNFPNHFEIQGGESGADQQ